MRKKHKHKWKYQINIKKKILVLVILGVSLFVGLGYAIIGSNLNIFGTLEIGKIDKTLYGALQKEVYRGYAKEYIGNHQDSMDSSKSTENIYHYYADTSQKGTEILDRNNVVFAGSCWQMIRTTDTGGVKLLYNGEPETTVVNGKTQYNCGDTRNYYHLGGTLYTYNINGKYVCAKNYTATTSGKNTTFTLVDDPDDPDDYKSITINASNAATTIPDIAANYPYVCSTKTATCTNEQLYKVESQSTGTTANVYQSTYRDAIGRAAFNESDTSLAYAGYMYGDVYTYKSGLAMTDTSPTYQATQTVLSNTTFADTYKYSKTLISTGTSYSLDNPILGSDIPDSDYSGYYTYRSADTVSGDEPYYIVGKDSGQKYYYVRLSQLNQLSDFNIMIGTDLVDNGDDTYTVKNGTGSATAITVDDWYSNYSNYSSKYACYGSSDTCSAPGYIRATGRSNYTYVLSDKITISTERNGLQLSGDVRTIRFDQWYQEYKTTYKDYNYTCGNTDTVCTEENLKYITSKDSLYYKYVKNRYFGESVVYEDNVYKLQNTIPLENATNMTQLSTHHYTCVDIGQKECASVAYMYYTRTGTSMYYITLDSPDVTSIQDVLNDMQTKNTTNSNIKNKVDSWYERKFLNTSYEATLDDTIYCNDRTYSTKSGYTYNESGWNPNGGSLSKELRFLDLNGDISCINVTDSFSVTNNKAKLTYPIGLVNAKEMDLLNQNSARESPNNYWTLSPLDMLNSSNDGVRVTNIYPAGSISSNFSDFDHSIRPMISLVKGTTYYRGNGSMLDPYVVDSDVKINPWKDTQLSSTSITDSMARTTISHLGSTTNGNSLSNIEYYTTCSSGAGTGSLEDPVVRDIINGSSISIKFDACPGAVLYYRLKDSEGNYSDGWNKVDNIAQYVLYAEVYNHMIYAGGTASNDDSNLSFWINNNNYANTAHRLISMSYYDEDSEATVDDLDTTTIVERAYPTFLGREADDDKYTWITKLNNGELTNETFFLSFINSTEAKNIRSAWGLDNSEYHP